MILLIGKHCERLIPYLDSREGEDYVFVPDDKIDLDFVKGGDFSFLISFGYRYILTKDILDEFGDKAINLHISYLPWNKGADPNFWSFLHNTPKGVTIHHIDEGLDTGDIILQIKLFFENGHTLASTYEMLMREVVYLFEKNWPFLKEGSCLSRRKQAEPGSYHCSKDKEPFSELLKDGWDIPVSIFGY